MQTQSTSTCVGLRVDVDTFRGTRIGVPALLEELALHGIRASFFFSVGPDNMGRHLWRLLRPAFLWKMLRSNAVSLYGWDILLRGTFWPGRKIGIACRDVIRATASAGHEVGLHAWDHHRWQARLAKMSEQEVLAEVARGMQELENLLGACPPCSATAGWQCNTMVLRAKESYRPVYNSDCRGSSVFRPLLDGKPGAPQVPVTLPTYDEVIGRAGTTDQNYNSRLLDSIRPGALNVLTIHAEVEGIAKRDTFAKFLRLGRDRGIHFMPLSHCIPSDDKIPIGAIEQGVVNGRAGTLCRQVAA